MFGRKTFFILGLGSGYVLGAKAGRERYEQIAQFVAKANGDPRVQKVTETVTAKGGQAIGGATKLISDKVGDKLPDWVPLHREHADAGSSNGHNAH
jgi:hypothetical protein